MNIWIVSAYDPVPVVDSESRLLRYGLLAEAFEAAGHNVVFWTSTFAHWIKRQRFEHDTVRQLRSTMSAEFLFAPGYRRNVSLARVRHNRCLARGFARRAEAHAFGPDLIVAEIPCLELAEAAVRFARKANVPFVCDIQDIWPDVYLTWLPRSLWRGARVLLASEYSRLRRILSGAAAVTAVSEAYRRWTIPSLGRALSDEDQVFPLGYALPQNDVLDKASSDLEAFRHRFGLMGLVVTFIGQFGTSYDLETVVEAAKLLAARRGLPPLSIVLAGDGDKRKALGRQAARLRSVVFTGWLSFTEALALLMSTDIALAAYQPNAAQSLSYKPFEYMAFGLPIVNSLPGELAETVEHAQIGLNYQAGSPRSLADAIERLISNAHLRTSCSRRAKCLFEDKYRADKIYPHMAQHLLTFAAGAKTK